MMREEPASPKVSRKHHKHSSISIFNKVEVNVQPKDAPPSPPIHIENSADKKEDGCTSCFKGLFKSLRR